MTCKRLDISIKTIERLCRRFFECPVDCRDRSRRLVLFKIGPISERTSPMPPPPALILTDSQKVLFSAGGTDDAGNPAGSLSFVPVWSSSNTAVCTLEPSADGLTCVATTTGQLGTATITVADPTSSLKPSSQDITVVGGPATALGITAGAPESRL